MQNKVTHPASNSSIYGKTWNQTSCVTAQRSNPKFICPPAFSVAFSMSYLSVCTDPVFVQTNWSKGLWLGQGHPCVPKCKGRFGLCSLVTFFMPREKTACEACSEAGMIEAGPASSQHLLRCCCKGTEPLPRQVADRGPWCADSADVLCIWKTLCVGKA